MAFRSTHLHIDRDAAHIVQHILRDSRVVGPVDGDPLVHTAFDHVAVESTLRARAHPVKVQAVLPQGDASAALHARILDAHATQVASLRGDDALPAE